MNEAKDHDSAPEDTDVVELFLEGQRSARPPKKSRPKSRKPRPDHGPNHGSQGARAVPSARDCASPQAGKPSSRTWQYVADFHGPLNPQLR